MADNGNVNTGAGGIFDNTVVATVMWLATGLIFLVCPIISSAKQRRLCAARIRQRQWRVDDDDAAHGAAYGAAVERYERSAEDAGGPLSIEEQEEIRQLFLITQLSKYSKSIGSDDIKSMLDIEKEEGHDSTTSASSDDSTQDHDIESGCVQDTCHSNDGDTTDAEALVVELTQPQQSDTVVTVPVAGQCVLGDCEMRSIANGCAICLCEFEAGDYVAWSANADCPHVFHEKCIMNWMLALGRKEQKCRISHPERSTGDQLKDVITFPMLCPCCRQQYIEQPAEGAPSSPPASAGQSTQSGSLPVTPTRTQEEENERDVGAYTV